MKRILGISDFDTGSYYGLCPAVVDLPEGGQYRANKGQLYLLGKWQNLIDFVPKIDILLLVGDFIAGKQFRQEATETFLANPEEQAKAFIELIDPLLRKAKKTYAIKGTEYHDQKAGQAAERIAKDIGAEKWPDGKYSGWWLNLDVDGILFDVAHHQSVPVVYRGTPLEREGIFAAIAPHKAHRPQVIIRAHNHFFQHIEHSFMHLISMPCWNLQTPYMIRKSPNRMVPDIGGVLIEIDPRRTERGLDPIRVEKILYKYPLVEVMKA